MVRTTIKISEGLDARLRHEAARRGLTLSEVIREALEEHCGLQERPEAPRRELRFIGSYASGDADVSSRIDELLSEIYEERDRRREQR